MNLQNYFYVYERGLPKRLCDEIIMHGENSSENTALTGGYDKIPDNQNDLSQLYKTRNSSIVWMEDSWIYREIMPFIHEANKEAGWNFLIKDKEACQFTKYKETQHYSWHQDTFPNPYKLPRDRLDGYVRKISVTVSLSDGETYEGGDLEFDLRNNPDSSPNIIQSKQARIKGAITIFPSFIWHRVTPVTKGTRYSLVIWTVGEPFK
jgi:PKHD-type hydroxylase